MIAIHENLSLRRRFESAPDDPRPALVEPLTIEPGTMADYRALSRFHYRGGEPVAATRVDRLVRRQSTVVGRYLGRTGDTERVGVIVTILPPLESMLRHVATSDRYAGLSRRETATLLNREVRTIARVVVDPAWRGLGLAVRLVRHVLDQAETVYTEAFAAMGRAHPFFEKAGMTRYDRPPHPAEQRLLDALEQAGVDPVELAAPRDLAARIDAMPASRRAWLLRECRRWHRTIGRTPFVASRASRGTGRHAEPEAMLAAAGRRVLARPVYYLARRADGAGRDRPQ